MTVRVRLFAMLRERAGSDSLELELPDGANVGDALAALADVTAGHHVRDGGQPRLRAAGPRARRRATSWR